MEQQFTVHGKMLELAAHSATLIDDQLGNRLLKAEIFEDTDFGMRMILRTFTAAPRVAYDLQPPHTHG